MERSRVALITLMLLHLIWVFDFVSRVFEISRHLWSHSGDEESSQRQRHHLQRLHSEDWLLYLEWLMKPLDEHPPPLISSK
ncbi:hypothetical protein NFI96_023037 [Prochilodus magdalenae]|nr:hypothetical protein NFI96_023037 [Prochilodus magdalenae]